MGARAAEELLRLPVRVHGIELGRPVDLLLDLGPPLRALGFDVLCGDEEHRFLPFAAAEVREDEIEVGSTLTLLERAQLRYYREQGSTARAIQGATVELRGAPAGELRDLVVGRDGAIEAVLVDGERIDLGDDVEVRFPRRPAA